MGARSVELIRIGPGFGGFRLALRAGALGLDYPEGYAALALAIDRTFSLLTRYNPETWAQMTQERIDAVLPLIGGRRGRIDCSWDATSDRAGAVLVRAFFPFSAWPLGGWALYEGRHRMTDGTWIPFDQEETARLW